MKKITFMEMLLLSLMTVSISMSIFGKNPVNKEVYFKLDMTAELANIQDKNTVGIRGNIAPLSWDKTYLLKDDDGDGIYEGKLSFSVAAGMLAFKFVYGAVVWENEDNRELDLALSKADLPLFQWNFSPPLTKTEIKALKIPSKKLMEDFELVKTAYTTMHPGLYRYNTPATIEQHLADLKKTLSEDLTIPEAYIAFSRFTAKIKCGHTYANFWNQPTTVKRAITFQSDKVPFHFRIVDKRMLITESANPQLKRGMEILAINGRPWQDIFQAIMPLMRSDGANDGQRIVNMQLLGVDRFEPFDMYFPILFPPQNNQYNLEIVDLITQKKENLNVQAMSRKERTQQIKALFPTAIPSSEKDLWQFKVLDKHSALLTLHTFAIWNFQMDWKAYIKDVFDQLKQQQIPNLIIDIRYNGGGMDMVGLELFKYISKESVTIPTRKELFRFNEFPPSVKPYMSSWDNWFDKGIKKLKLIEPGYYAMNGKISKEQTFKPYKDTYAGKVYLLVSPYNSSATYYLAGTAKRQQLATLVGQETGGNLKGINGGQIYFLKLPNSKIELDVPIGGVFPLTEQPDRGYIPDVLVKPTPQDVANGIDSELSATLALIKEATNN